MYHLVDNRESLILAAIKKAIKENGFKVFYQPILEVKSGKFVAAEALLRLFDEKSGEIPPSEFIPVAERNGLIETVGETVFESACAFYSGNRLFESGVSYIEVNVSVLQCAKKGFAEKFLRIMRKYGVDAKRINFEITETIAAENGVNILDNIRALRAAGATFAVDDFGVGFSDEKHLEFLPVDVVKIDKSIVWQAMIDKDSREKLKLTIKTLHEHGLKTVAEGIETQETADTLSEFGCEFYQGFLFAHPLSEREYLAFIADKSREEKN